MEKHPVIEEIERRKAGDSPQLRLALTIEGGGMRGAVSGGMVAALETIDVGPEIFDTVYGSSGGSFNGAYYVAGQARLGSSIYWENNTSHFIDIRRFGRKANPALNLDYMLDHIMVKDKPIDFEKVVRARKLRPLATNIKTAKRHTFKPATSVPELRAQLKAGATIPRIAGLPAPVGDHLYYDAALTEAIPVEAAVEDKFEAILVLVTKPLESAHNQASLSNRALEKLALGGLRKINSNLAQIAAANRGRGITKSKLLMSLRDYPDLDPPHIYAISPEVGSATAGRLEKNPAKLLAAAQAGYVAVKNAFDLECSASFNCTGWLEDI